MIKTRNLMFAAMSCIATMSLTSCATILSGEEALRHNGEAQEQKFVIEEQATDIDTRAFDVVSIHIKSSFYLLLYFNPQGLICIYFNTGKIVNRRVVLP